MVQLVAFAPTVSAQESSETAYGVADAWLAQVDNGEYLETREQAATIFKDVVTGEQWAEAVSAARAPLGALQSREPESTNFTTSLPNAPQGEYVVVRYQTVYEKRPATIELVTLMREDGEWKVAGYFIH